MLVLSPHLVVNFKLLNDPEFQKHPERGGDHGIVVQGEVVEVELLDAQLTAQGDFSCLKERGEFHQSLEALEPQHHPPLQPGLHMHRLLQHIRTEI